MDGVPHTVARTVDDLRARIHRAFDDVLIPNRIADMLIAPYRGNEDAYEMASTFVGKPWSEIAILDLFRQRESLFALTPAAFLAYLPAYLFASLASDDYQDKYGADLRGYLVYALAAWPHHDELRATTTRERLAILDVSQRAVVANVLTYFATRWNMKDAAKLLETWSSN